MEGVWGGVDVIFQVYYGSVEPFLFHESNFLFSSDFVANISLSKPLLRPM